MNEVRAVLNRWLQTPAGREKSQPVAKLRNLEPDSSPAPLDVPPKHESENNEGKPLFTADQFRRVQEYLKFFTDGCCLLIKLNQTLSRPDLTDLETKQVAVHMYETLVMIEPFAPILDSLHKYCLVLSKVGTTCREFNVWHDNHLIKLKLDRLQRTLDHLTRLPDSNAQQSSATKQIDTLKTIDTIAELEAALTGRPH